jgi:serine/threonine-protein kinase HipA
MKKINVVYQGWGERWHLGTLADNGQDLLFEYSAQALDQQLELSPHKLPLRVPAYGQLPAFLHRLPGLIADALPDGWGMPLMDRMFRKMGRQPYDISPLDRLAFIGHRAMGALSFEPATDLPLAQEDIDLLGLAQETRDVIAGDDDTALRHLALIGGSPHGARPKALVYRSGANAMSTVASPDAQPWLIKFQAANEHKEVCAIEALYAHMARLCGLDTPETQYFDLGKGLAAFGIQRFDVEDDMRVPIHTLAGALHADFRMPSVSADTFLLLTRKLTRDEREVKKAFARVVFNVVFNNRDDHSKNFSYRMGRDRHWRLSPCYDLTFCHGPGGEHQMDVCGEGRAIGRAHLMQLAQACDLDPPWAAQVVDAMVAHGAAFTAEAGQYAIRRATVKDMQSAIDRNVARLSA